jgi:hypothetical protein
MLQQLLDWIETHPGVASWAQAVGAIVAIVAAFLISASQLRSERKRAAEERLRKAKGMALLLGTELRAFEAHLSWIVENQNPEDSIIVLPPTLVAHSADLYLLGGAGGALLLMISALHAHEAQRAAFVDALRSNDVSEKEVWDRMVGILQPALDSCREAITGMDRIVAAT